MSRLFAALILGIFLAALVGCGLPPPERTYVVQQPKTAPVRNITSFTPALQCMDDLFQSQGKNNFMITSAGIPDATGQMQAGTKEMLISTIAKMSTKSNAFTFVDLISTSEMFWQHNNSSVSNLVLKCHVTIFAERSLK